MKAENAVFSIQLAASLLKLLLVIVTSPLAAIASVKTASSDKIRQFILALIPPAALMTSWEIPHKGVAGTLAERC